jgi:hypothetical protein
VRFGFVNRAGTAASHQIISTDMPCDNCGDCNDACEPFLEQVRVGLNKALALEGQDVPGHVSHTRLELQYGSACVPPEAWASTQFGLINVNKGMRCRVWQACERLCNSIGIMEALNRSSEIGIMTVLLTLQMAWIVAHEWSHVVRGHPDASTGGRESHAVEVDADGYATFHLIHLLVKGPLRTLTSVTLDCGPNQTSEDATLYTAFVIAIGGLLFSFRPSHNTADIYSTSHPPLAARMHWVMWNSTDWCQRNKPELEQTMPLERWQAIMHLAASSVWGLNGGVDWDEQVRFLRSTVGQQYVKEVEAAANRWRRSR